MNDEPHFECPICGSKLYFCADGFYGDSEAAICVGRSSMHVDFEEEATRVIRGWKEAIEALPSQSKREDYHQPWKMEFKDG